MTRINSLIVLAFAAAAGTWDANAGTTDLKVYGMAAPSTAGATWVFRLYQQEGALALSAILPKELHADGVTIYVTPDPTYR